MLKALVLTLGLVAGAASSTARACDSNEFLHTQDGFIFKVVGNSDQVEAYAAPGSETGVFNLDLLQPYYVICEVGDYYRVSEQPTQFVEDALTGKTGYIRKNQVYAWPTSEALNFSPLIWSDRPEIVAWDDEAVVDRFMETGDQRANPPAFREDRQTTLKRERALQPYPVLSSEVKKLRGVVDKRVFNVLFPAELPAGATVVINDQSSDIKQKLEAALVGTTIVIAYDATASQEPYDLAYAIKTAFEGLPEDVQDNVNIGLVFFRDKDDDEKLFVVEPQPVKDAMNTLIDASKSGAMKGGGDAAEPVLDAVYYSMAKFAWASDGRGGGASRIILAVLNGDAKPTTEGFISPDVPAGLDAAELANQLAARAIRTITLQDGPTAGEDLTSVLSTLADGTGGEFIEWAGDHGRETYQTTANELARMSGDAVNEGRRALATLGTNGEGYPTLLLSTLDSAKLNALRQAGIKFTINAGENTALVQPGFMLENPDLLEPQIRIEKDTLDALINLFSILAVTGIDFEAQLDSAGEVIAAIAGEDYDREAPIAELIGKRLGIAFRTPLLEYNLEYMESILPIDRLGVAKRIQDAADRLAYFRDANLEAFNTSPAVWMPVSYLP
jgi:hypothetical protein